MVELKLHKTTKYTDKIMLPSARATAGQQLMQLRNRLGGGGSRRSPCPSSADGGSNSSSAAADTSTKGGSSGAGADATPPNSAATGTGTGTGGSTAISDGPSIPAVDLSAVLKAKSSKSKSNRQPSSSSSSRKPSSSRRQKHRRQESEHSKASSSTTKSKSKTKSGRRIRPGRGGPGKEGRRRKRREHNEDRTAADREGGAGAWADQQVFVSKGSSVTSSTVGGGGGGGGTTDGRSVVPSVSITGTTAGGGFEATTTTSTTTTGKSAWTTRGGALPPHIGLERNRTYSDHTQVTGTGTLTTAVSTRQATIEGMSHQDDGHSNSELLTCEMASVSLGLDDNTHNSALGLEGGATLQLDELDDDEDGCNSGVALAIHTFPCRGRSLEAPAPFDERGADAMTRYRQHDEDEYLTDESSEVVVPLHWPKARRPSQGGGTQLGFAVVEATADYETEKDDDQDEDDDVGDDGNFAAAAASSSSSAAAAVVVHDHQDLQEEEVTGEEIEVEVQDTEAAVITTTTTTTGTNTTTTTKGPEKTTASAAKDGAASATTTNTSIFGRPPLRLPLSISIGRAGHKTPTDHAFSAAVVVTPEHRRIGSNPSKDEAGDEKNVAKEEVHDDDNVSASSLKDGVDGGVDEQQEEAILAKTPSNDDSESTPPGLVPFSPPLPTRTASFPNLNTRTSSFSALPHHLLPNPIPFVKAQSCGAHSTVPIGSNTSSAWKSWNAAVVAATAAAAVPIPRSVLTTPSPSNLRGTPTMSDHGSIVHVHRPGSGGDVASSSTSTVPATNEGPSKVIGEAVEVQDTTTTDQPSCKSSDGSTPSVEISTEAVVEIEETPTKLFRSSPDGSTASTVKIRTVNSSKAVGETAKRPSPMSPGEATAPTVTSISFEVSPEANRYLNPKLDDGKLYSEHPHDEAPSPSVSTGAAAAAAGTASPTQHDIFRSCDDAAEEDDSGRSDFPKIALSSSSGSHSLPAVLSPAYKFAPIDSPYYASDSETCFGEEDSNYDESESDGDYKVSQDGVEIDAFALGGDNVNDGNGAAATEEDERKLPPVASISASPAAEAPLDTSIDGQSGRYESFASGGRALMRNLTQLDDSTASIVEEQNRPRRPSPSGSREGRRLRRRRRR